MRVKQTLACTCVATATLASAQLENKSYELISDLVLKECDANGAALDAAKVMAAGESPDKYCDEGWRFVVLKAVDADTYVLAFFDWYSESELQSNTRDRKSIFRSEDLDADRKNKAALYNYDMARLKGLRDRFFLISKDQLMNAAIPLPQQYAPIFGAMVLPFKYRPQSGVVSKDLSLGAVGGIQFRSRSNTSLAFMFGATVSSITVDSATTRGNVVDNSERSALSLPLGILFQWDQLQIGFLTGWDFMFDGNPDAWCYQGKPWFTIGVGIAVFTAEGNASEAKQR